MKEPEFIELLNLYVDHEIAPDDAARLEAEVLTNEARRRMYHQYCLMHKGCSLLAGQFQESAPEAPRVAQRSYRRPAWTAGIYGAGLLAAACVALLIVSRVRTVSGIVANSVANVKDVSPQALAAGPFGGDLQPVVDMRSLSLNSAGRPMFAAPAANTELAWLDQVQFAPIARVQINAVSLKGSVGAADSETRITPDLGAGDTQIENVSFKFQR